MINRSAASHLALVVSVLICFFVFMGYHLRGKLGVGATGDDRLALADGGASGSGLQSPTSLMTVNDSQSASAPNVSAPIATPSGRPPSLGGGESAPNLGEVVRPGLEDDGSPVTSGAGLPPPPSGSIEESGKEASPSASPEGMITGLIPAPPASSSPTPPAASASPIPPPPAPERRVSAPPPSGGGLKPPPLSGETTPPSSENADDSSFVTVPGVITPPPPGPGSAMLPPPPSSSSLPPPPARDERAGEPTGASLQPPRPDNRRPDPSPPVNSGPVVSPPPGGTRLVPPPGPAGTQNGEPSASDSVRIYIIRPGDNLSHIAARELGDMTLADNIFLMNRDVIADPDHLQVGMRIRLPAKDQIAPPATPVPPRPTRNVEPTPVATPVVTPVPTPQPPANRNARVHRVAPGDTLSSISRRYYGSSAGWRFLYESNANVIPNPNQLTVGTELVIPAYGER